MTGQVVGYVRVSTVDQNTERQLDGITVDRMFTDHASGKDTHRPELQACLKYVRDGDTLIVHSMDRLARSLKDLLGLVEDLNGRGVTVRIEKNNLTLTADKSDPCSTLMMQMLGAVAEFERALILERQREGIALAKAKGVYKGRKPALTDAQVLVVLARLAGGESAADLAREFGVARATIYNVPSRAAADEESGQ